MKLKFSILLVFFLYFAVFPSLGQYVIKGRVSDAKNGDPIPFASVGLVGVSQGATTNFQGEFTLNSKYSADSLFASFVGYKKRVKKITRGAKFQEIEFQLEPTGREMAEVIVYSGENPAFKILRVSFAIGRRMIVLSFLLMNMTLMPRWSLMWTISQKSSRRKR